MQWSRQKIGILNTAAYFDVVTCNQIIKPKIRNNYRKEE